MAGDSPSDRALAAVGLAGRPPRAVQTSKRPALERAAGDMASITVRLQRRLRNALDRMDLESRRGPAGADPDATLLPSPEWRATYELASRVTVAMVDAQLARDRLCLARERELRRPGGNRGELLGPDGRPLTDLELIGDAVSTLTDAELQDVLTRRAKASRLAPARVPG